MKTRIITAFIFAMVMVGIPFLGPIPSLFLYILIAGGCAYELAGLKNISFKFSSILVAIFPLTLSFLYFLQPALFKNPLQWGLGLICFYLLFYILELFKKNNQSIESSGITSFSFLFVGIPFSLVPILLYAENSYSPLYLLGTLVFIWSNDSFAYLIGSNFGKTKIFHTISPNKTLEGYVGGALLTFILALILALIFRPEELILWGGVGIISAIMGSLGDLFESLLKRNAGVKDTGSFMPGHGGWLDRFDAMIFVLPFATFWIILNLN